MFPAVLQTYRLDPSFGYRSRLGDDVAIGIPLGAGALFTGGGEYLGYTARETTGVTAASFTVYNGIDSSGLILDEVSLTPGESSSANYTQPGKQLSVGLWVDVRGSVAGSLFMMPHTSDSGNPLQIVQGLTFSFAGSPIAQGPGFDVIAALSGTGNGLITVCDNALKQACDDCPYLIRVYDGLYPSLGLYPSENLYLLRA